MYINSIHFLGQSLIIFALFTSGPTTAFDNDELQFHQRN